MKSAFAITLFLILVFPTIGYAAGFDYATFSTDACGNLSIQTGALENKKTFYGCGPATLTCNDTVAPKNCDAVEPTRDGLLKNLRAKNPEIWNASRVKFSSTNRYLVYYVSSKVNKDQLRHHVVFNLTNPNKPTWSEVTSKMPNWDLLTEANRLFSFSPDESFLIYLDDRNGYPTLYRANLPQAGKKLVSAKMFSRAYSVGDFMVWDKNTIYYYANREDSLTWTLYQYRLDTKVLTKIADNVSYGQTLDRSGDYLLFARLVGNRQLVSRYDPTTGKAADFNLPSIAGVRPILAHKKITLADRQVVIVRPEVKKLGQPLIIWLHGGPYRQIAGQDSYHPYPSYAVYDWLLEQLADSGAVVAKVDYVGSYGYGRKFADTIVGQVGKKDIADVLAVTAELKKLYRPSEIYLVGNSYGGYLSLRGLVADPKPYAGVVSINGVTDWTALLEHYQNSIFNTYFKGLRADANDPLFVQANIAAKLDRVTNQKILLVQNSADKTIPPKQADWLANILSLRHKNYQLINYAGEDHVFSQSKNIIDLCRQIATFVNLSAKCEW